MFIAMVVVVLVSKGGNLRGRNNAQSLAARATLPVPRRVSFTFTSWAIHLSLLSFPSLSPVTPTEHAVRCIWGDCRGRVSLVSRTYLDTRVGIIRVISNLLRSGVEHLCAPAVTL